MRADTATRPMRLGVEECARDVFSSPLQAKALAHARSELGLDQVSWQNGSPPAAAYARKLRRARCDARSRERARDVISGGWMRQPLLHARLQLGLDQVS